MLSLTSFNLITDALLNYHKELRSLENNLNVSFDDNWMVHVLDNVIKGLAFSFYEDVALEKLKHKKTPYEQVTKIKEFLQYFIYAWECGKEAPDWIVYERFQAIEGVTKLQCRCQYDAYEIIKDFISHPEDDVTWRMEAT